MLIEVGTLGEYKNWRGDFLTKVLLHLEGLAVLIMSIFFYASNGFSWLLFFLLLFVPDLWMIGYVYNPKIGAAIYNVVHTYVFTIIVVFAGVVFSNDVFLAIGLISAAHIGMDRTCGYGLKYPTDFKDSHLQRV